MRAHGAGSIIRPLIVAFCWISGLLLGGCSEKEPKLPSDAELFQAVEAALPDGLRLETQTFVQPDPNEVVQKGDQGVTLVLNAEVLLLEDFVSPAMSEDALAITAEIAGTVYDVVHAAGTRLTARVEVEGKYRDHTWFLHVLEQKIPDLAGEPVTTYDMDDVRVGSPQYEAMLANLTARKLASKPVEKPKPAKAAVSRPKPAPTIVEAAEPVLRPLSGEEIARNIHERNEGVAVSRQLRMEMTDKGGRRRERHAWVYRRVVDGRKETLIRFVAPRKLRGMAFLTHDFVDPEQEDEQWLYMSATRKVRRIPASDRGDFFVGTDFTYNDVKEELKFEPTDYHFDYIEAKESDGGRLLKIQGKPRSPDVARELGYGGVEAWIDEKTWMPVDILFRDLEGRPLKKVQVSGLVNVAGVWTAHHIEAQNLQTGHATIFQYSDVTYRDSLPEDVFGTRNLRTGQLDPN